jgi:hypothetical protein
MHKLTHLGHQPRPDTRGTRGGPHTPSQLAPDGACRRVPKSTEPARPYNHKQGPTLHAPQPSQPHDRALADDGSFTTLYIDVMHAAVRSSDDWGAWAMLGESLRGVGLLAIVGAPVGLPCALVADAVRLGGRRWHKLRSPTTSEAAANRSDSDCGASESRLRGNALATAHEDAAGSKQ